MAGSLWSPSVVVDVDGRADADGQCSSVAVNGRASASERSTQYPFIFSFRDDPDGRRRGGAGTFRRRGAVDGRTHGRTHGRGAGDGVAEAIGVTSLASLRCACQGADQPTSLPPHVSFRCRACRLRNASVSWHPSLFSGRARCAECELAERGKFSRMDAVRH